MQRKRKDKSDSSSSSSGSTQIRSSRPRYCRCGPLCWILMGFKSVLGAMVITVLVVNYTSSHDLLSVFRRWGSSGGSSSSSSAFSSDFDVDSKLLFSEEYAPCHGLVRGGICRLGQIYLLLLLLTLAVAPSAPSARARAAAAAAAATVVVAAVAAAAAPAGGGGGHDGSGDSFKWICLHL